MKEFLMELKENNRIVLPVPLFVWDYSSDMLDDKDMVKQAYQNGVPLVGDLPAIY